MADAVSQGAWDHYCFLLGVSIARKVVNCFVDYLCNPRKPGPKAGYRDVWGRRWQTLLLGGVITDGDEEYQTSRTPGAGTLWMRAGPHTHSRIPRGIVSETVRGSTV
jgi:hypothetical protein